MAISRSGSTTGAFLGAGPVAGSDPQDERISGDGVDCNGLGIMFNTSLPNCRLIGEGKSIEHRQVIRACGQDPHFNGMIQYGCPERHPLECGLVRNRHEDQDLTFKQCIRSSVATISCTGGLNDTPKGSGSDISTACE